MSAQIRLYPESRIAAPLGTHTTGNRLGPGYQTVVALRLVANF
jgi:hypothetical protein